MSSVTLIAQTSRSALTPSVLKDDVSSNEHQVTVSNYCQFLNAVAHDDPHQLYDGKMDSGSKRSFILRLGLPGNYVYQVIEERREATAIFISFNNAVRYCHWKGASQELAQRIGAESEEIMEGGVSFVFNDGLKNILPESVDHELKSSSLGCYLQDDSNTCSQAGLVEVETATTLVKNVIEFVVGVLSVGGTVESVRSAGNVNILDEVSLSPRVGEPHALDQMHKEENGIALSQEGVQPFSRKRIAIAEALQFA